MILTKEQQAQKYAEKIAGNTCMAPVIAETWLAGYTACEQSMWRSVEEGLREEKGIDVLVWNCSCGYGWEISKADTQSRGTTLMVYDDNGEDKDSGMWLTYENALYAGIVVALQFIDN